MNLTSVIEIERLKNTIGKVDQEISRRRTEIKRNMVPNAGIATRELQYMEMQNNQRKGYLHVNRGQIEVLYSKSKGYNTMRSSFITPDGPKHKGNRGKPTKTIQQIRKERAAADQRRLQERSRPKRVDKFIPPPKSIKKFNPPPKPISISLPTQRIIAKPVSPALPITKVTDAIRQQTHIAAKQKSLAIKKQMDARRDAELVKQGKVALVAKRRQADMVKEHKEGAYKLSVSRRAKINDIKARALNASKNAQKQAQRKATSIVRSTRGRSRSRRSNPFSRSRKGTGGPPNHLVMKFSDKRRAAVINDQIRTNETPVTQAAMDHFTEDIRQAPAARPRTRSKESDEARRYFGQELRSAGRMLKEVRGSPDATALSPDRQRFYYDKARSLLRQVRDMIDNEITRWDQGMLNAGVAISTDNRSQSTRKMSLEEFKTYIAKKVNPMIMPLMQEVQQEWERAYRLRFETEKAQEAPVVSRDISLGQASQRHLLDIDNRRGKGRPVLTEQQGTTGLAGLFPALRSSMQGALK